MRQTISISLPEDIKRELDRATSAEGSTRSEIIREAIRDYLFVQRFRSLRRGMMRKAQSRGVFTDEDVFKRVS